MPLTTILIIFSLLFFLFLFIFRDYIKQPFTLNFIFGKKGAGKSLYMVKLMRRYLRRGYTVYSDISVNLPGVVPIKADDLADHWPVEYSAIFLDEAGLLFDNRSFKTFKKGHTEFFKLQRKCRTVVWLNSQSFDIDKKIRDVTDRMYLQSRFLVWTICRPIARTITLTEPDGDNESRVADKLKFKSFFSWKWTFIPRFTKYFDSFELPYRPYLNDLKESEDNSCAIED